MFYSSKMLCSSMIKKITLLGILIPVFGLILGSAEAFGSGRVQRVTTIFDFSDPSQLDLWETSDHAVIKMTKMLTMENDFAARISFLQWCPDKDIADEPVEDDVERDLLHPAPSPNRFAGIAKAPIEIVRDSERKLSDYDFLEFDILNSADERLFVNFELSASEGPRNISFHIDLRPGEGKTYRIPLREFPVTPARDNIGRFLSGDDADGLAFRMDFPSDDFSVHLKSIRLVQDPGYPLDDMISKLEERREVLGKLTDQVNFDYYGDLLAEGNGDSVLPARLDYLLDEARELRERHRDDSSFTWDEIEKVRREKHALRERKEAFNLDWDLFRAVAHVSADQEKEADFALAVESPLRKVFLEKERFGSEFPQDHRYRLHAARNESESFQSVIFPLRHDLEDVTWEVNDLLNDDGGMIPASVREVGYVETRYIARSGRSRDGWWPDPLLEHPEVVETIPADEVLPLWIIVEVPEDAAAGVYTGELSVSAGVTTRSLVVELEVLDLTLPRSSSLPSVNQFYDLSRVQNFDAPTEPEETHEERRRKTRKRIDNWMLEYRMQPGSIYAGSPPDWDVERLKDLVDRGLNAINLAYIRVHRRDADDYDEEWFWEDHAKPRIESIHEYIPTLKQARPPARCAGYPEGETY